jgi:eukaryotic-like serine/threonine-protein kinase
VTAVAERLTVTTVGRTAVSATGRLIYVARGSSVYGDPADLVWISRGGVASPLSTGWTGVFQSTALSPDGHRAAVGLATESGEELQVRDLSTGSLSRVAIPGTLLRDPVFSPDGRWLYFVGMGASHGLHRVRPGGAAPPERVVASEFVWIGHPAPAPDADHVYHIRDVAGATRQLVRQSMSGGPMDTVATAAGGDALRPQVSPDGRWLAYLSSGSGRLEVYVRSTDAARSEDWPISQAADRGTALRWSRAGNELYYIARDSMMAVRVSGTPSFAAETPRALFPTSGLRPAFDRGTDGRLLMIRQRPDLRPPTELVMLERWTDLLPR